MHSRLKFDIEWPMLVGAIVGAGKSHRDSAVALDALKRAFDWPDLVPALSVRTLFDAILAEMALPANSPIIMSGINIQNMADIVAAHNLKLVSVDIDPMTLMPREGALLAAHDKSQAKICVLAQLFGSVGHLPDLERLRQRDVIIIEDAAQAFSGRVNHSSKDADIALFSFGPIKRRTALGGAFAVFRDQTFSGRVRQRLDTYPIKSEAWFRIRALKYLLLKIVTYPLFYGVIIRSIVWLGRDPEIVIGSAARGFSGDSFLDAIKHRPPNRLITLLVKQVLRVPDYQERRTIANDFLNDLPNNFKLGQNVTDHAYWLMPLSVNDPEAFIDFLRRKGFDATRGATSLRALSPDMTSEANRLMKHLVYIPNPVNLSAEVRQKLKLAILEAL